MSKLYLDDLRPCPDGWDLVSTADSCISVLKNGGVTHLSLDHDLGEDPAVGCGYDVLLWLEQAVVCDGFVPPEVITVHSDNAGARRKMNAAIQFIFRFYNR